MADEEVRYVSNENSTFVVSKNQATDWNVEFSEKKVIFSQKCVDFNEKFQFHNFNPLDS